MLKPDSSSLRSVVAHLSQSTDHPRLRASFNLGRVSKYCCPACLTEATIESDRVGLEGMKCSHCSFEGMFMDFQLLHRLASIRDQAYSARQKQREQDQISKWLSHTSR